MNCVNGELQVEGHVRIFPKDNPSGILFEEKNLIVLGIKYLFARIFANINEPAWSVYGLALGAGDSSWATLPNPPDAVVTNNALISPLLRKPISDIGFVDSNYNPVAPGSSSIVNFQTVINASTDNLVNQAPIMEMGLIGGGSRGVTVPSTAPYWNSTTYLADSMVLLNYKTLPPLIFPANVDFIISWALTF
jgi:hypothetical protein